ncbi:MAG: DUF288 domain-containing protein [Deltaproteobacteria bacterium]|nr:DUF288 domain-containing protein [Deltaproteobacteria bacterium]
MSHQFSTASLEKTDSLVVTVPSRIGVVTPLANEESTIDSFLDRVLAQLGPNDRIFCVLDKACKDKTVEKIKSYHQTKDDRAVLVWAPENRSVVDAYFRGYKEAYEAGCDWILEMDGGLSHLPEEIPNFLNAMKEDVDFIAGSRFMKGGSYSGPFSRHFISRGGTFLANLILKTRMRDMTSGFECFSRRAMQMILRKGTKSRSHFFQTEIKHMLHSWKWKEVPINYKNPSKGLGSSSLKDAFKNLWHLYKQTPVSMTEEKVTCVVTTIQQPTKSIKKLASSLEKSKSSLLIIGDKKGPSSFDQKGADVFSLAKQNELSFTLAKTLPVGHYARKNLGYLLAIQQKAKCIYETDDDNMPNDHWKLRSMTVKAQAAKPRTWMNVYRVFSNELIWPRGFPLEEIREEKSFAHNQNTPEVLVDCPIQQGLADLSPDVDAIWRLALDNEFYFDRKPSLWLAPGTWCPFNSQTTWWWPVAYPLMYLPSHCTFRMTDIWRSFIAQRCLWELGYGMVFHSAEVIQERNEHRLLSDFAGEVSGYLQNEIIIQTLNKLKLKSGAEMVSENLISCYEALVKSGHFPQDEMELVKAWTEDLAALPRG